MKTTKPSPARPSPGQHARTVSYYLGHFLIYLGFLMIALVIVWLILKVNRIYATYRVATHHLTALEAAAQAGPSERDLAQVNISLRGMATSLEMLYEELTPFLPLTPYLGWMPVYGGDLQALPDLVAAGRDLSQAGVILAETLSPGLRLESEVGEVGLLPYLVARLSWEKTDLKQAEARLRQHQAIISDLKIEKLSPRVARRATQLNQYLPQVISGLQLARGLPVLLGGESPQTYLILAQNSDELRPTGGYINAAGHIVFDQGQVVEFVMQDSYAVDQLSEDYPYPPEPLYQYMAAEYWVLRDASWSPDFPTTARTAIKLYELGQGISAEGVIAIDQQALPYVLRAFESLQVEGERVTSDNVIELLRQNWAPEVGQESGGVWWSQRKSFILALAETIRQELEQGLGENRLLVLGRALQQALAEKHILVYLEDPVAADFLARQNWSGALQPVQSDYLMVVDANVGFNKASASVERRITYRVTLAKDGSAQSHATLVYYHAAQKHREKCWNKLRYDPVYEQNMARCYWNYLRVVVPAGANLVSGPQIVVEGEYLLRGLATSGDIDVALLGTDKVSWGQLFLLAPEESLILDYVYTLPPGTARKVGDQWAYTLYLQKQPGTLEPTVDMIVSLPEGAQFIESEPQPVRQQDAMSAYSVSLRTDEKIEVLYRLP